MNIYDLALIFTPRITEAAIQHLLEHFGSAEAIFNSSVEQLVLKSELNESIARSIVYGVAMPEAEREAQYCSINSIKMIASTDEEYPPLLREIPDPPHVLFVMGDHSVLSRRCISVVGTRNHSAYGERSCINIIDQLSKRITDIVIVSGLAYGIDGVAHRSALTVDIPTVAVMPSPLPTIRPVQHSGLAREIVRYGGALISEFPSTTTYAKHHYIKRNRIIAALSHATLIMESDSKGGSLHTARLARDYNRAVFAAPGHMGEQSFSGCNNLISQSVASILISANSIIYELGWESTEQADSSEEVAQLPKGVSFEMLSTDHLAIMRCFNDGESLHISEIERRSSLPISKVNGLLIELELLELISIPHSAHYRALVQPKIFTK